MRAELNHPDYRDSLWERIVTTDPTTGKAPLGSSFMRPQKTKQWTYVGGWQGSTELLVVENPF